MEQSPPARRIGRYLDGLAGPKLFAPTPTAISAKGRISSTTTILAQPKAKTLHPRGESPSDDPNTTHPDGSSPTGPTSTSALAATQP